MTLDKLIKEAVKALKKELVKERKTGTKIDFGDIAEAVDNFDLHLDVPTKKAFYVGYLRGVAEAQDMTITELLESI